MSRHAPTTHALRTVATRARVVTIVGVVLVLALLAALSLRGSGSDSRLMLRATFTDASPLLEGNDVRLGGVKVGTVASMRIVEGGAEVMVELQREALPVHSDAKLTIRPVSLLGERFVELDRGSADQPVLADGARLGIEQTGASVDLDEVLNTLDDPTAQGLASLVGTLGQGLDGNGEAVQRALAALAPALGDTRGLTRTLAEQNATLSSLVDSLSRVASGIATDDGQQLERLISASTTVLGKTSANEVAFRSMLREMPSTIRAARTTLSNLEGTADAAAPTLAALRPTTTDLRDISKELLAFAKAADPALASANPVLEKADALIRNARPIAQLLRQQAPALRNDVAALDPLTKTLVGDFTSVMEFVRGWALATNAKDGLSHYFRAGLVLTEYSVTGLLPGGVPATPSAPAPTKPGTAKSPTTPKGGGLGNVVPDLLDGVGELLGSLLSRKTDRTGGVTGLTPRQESNALSFLLGGS